VTRFEARSNPWQAHFETPPLPSDALEIRFNEPMARHTTLRLGGPADVWLMPRTRDAARSLLAWLSDANIPTTFVGGGTNLLVRDGGIRGAVVNLGHLQAIAPQDPENPGLIHVEAGAHTSKLLQVSIERELCGLEFLAGVPGSVGGGLRMNAGTYLGEFTNVVTQVRSLSSKGEWIARDHAACGFVYRNSALPSDELVIDATLHLQPGRAEEIRARAAELKARKRDREPKAVGNNGSTFKNPPGDFAGRIIEAAGLKGVSLGGAQVSPVHANWLVVANSQICTSADLLGLIEIVREKVQAHSGIELELEVRIIGEA
jgi:UDP-N-acetylmuramate dehydrogenase